MLMEKKLIAHCSFEDIVSRFPENTAIVDGSRQLTYRQLNAAANRVAHALAEIGVTNGYIAGIYSNASIEYVTSILGVLKAGAIFMPMNAQFPDERLSAILAKTEPSVLITSTVLENEFSIRLQKFTTPVYAKHMLVLENASNLMLKSLPSGMSIADGSSFSEQNPPYTVNPDNGCYIITTSGSTGGPKAILGCHKGLAHFINWEISEFELTDQIRVSALSGVTFDVILRDIFVPLLTGGALCVVDEETRHNPAKLLTWLEKSDVTLTHMVPTVFRLLIQEIENRHGDKQVLPNLKYILLAGEALYGHDVIKWRQVAGNRKELINLYGPSETTLAKLYYRIKDNSLSPQEIVPIGKPIADTEVLIIENGKLCSVGQIGEIYIKTSYRSKGYYKDDNLNKKRFIQNPLVHDRQEIVYRTGDFGSYMPDGIVRFEGRRDGQIKLHGNRIEIGEIEIVLRQHLHVREAAAALKEDSLGNHRLVGYVVPSSDEQPTIESLRQFVAAKLPDYMVPSAFVTMESLPITHSGKIDRRALPEPSRTRPQLAQEYVAPATQLERSLAGIWCQVLNLERVGIRDNFFDLGGTSLLAVRTVVQVQQAMNVEVPIVKLFQYPNIRDLADCLNQQQLKQPSYDYIRERAARRRAAFSRKQRAMKG